MTDNQFNQLFDLVTKTVTGIQEVKKDVSTLKQDMAEVKQDVSTLKQDMAEVKQDVSTLKQDMAEVKQGISILKTDVAELKEGQKRIEKEVRLNTIAINEVAGGQFGLKIRVDELEKASV